MFPRLLPALMAGLFVGLAAGQAHAGLFDDEEARLRINEMRNEFNGRVSKLESGARAQLELADQIELLKTEIARLRGENEVLSNDLANAVKRQKDFYVDLDNRLRKLEPHAAAEYYAKVANQWPDDNRAPDALLGLASAQQAQGDAKAATRSLERLAAKYPSSSAAQIARQRLKK